VLTCVQINTNTHKAQFHIARAAKGFYRAVNENKEYYYDRPVTAR